MRKNIGDKVILSLSAEQIEKERNRMTQDEAIKWLDNILSDIGQVRHQDLWDYAQALSEISQMIADTPAEPKTGKWIPCSERLPEEGRYLVTRHDDVSKTNFTDILWFEKNVWWNRQFTGNFVVIAWMPLPEPYKG